MVEKARDIYNGLAELGYPAVLKTARGGYDGKGQYVIKESSQIAEAEKLLNNGVCVLEKWISFNKEISVIITRSGKGEATVFQLVKIFILIIFCMNQLFQLVLVT